MALNWKIIVIVGIVILFVVLIGYYQVKQGTPEYSLKSPTPGETAGEAGETAGETPETLPEIPKGEPTANIDDIVGTLLQEADEQTRIMKEEDTDVSVGDADSQAISDFGQSYDKEL